MVIQKIFNASDVRKTIFRVFSFSSIMTLHVQPRKVLNTLKGSVHYFKNNASNSSNKSKAVTESRSCLPIYLKIGVNIIIAGIVAKLHSCLRLLLSFSFNFFDNIFNSFCFQIAHCVNWCKY